MQMSRSDVRIDNKLVVCQNATWIGFSSSKLKRGMFFTYKDGEQIKLAKMHHRIAMDPLNISRGHIVAQVANISMSFTMERWINPANVLETIPAERMDDSIADFFVRKEYQQ